jgi:hypothetical protein
MAGETTWLTDAAMSARVVVARGPSYQVPATHLLATRQSLTRATPAAIITLDEVREGGAKLVPDQRAIAGSLDREDAFCRDVRCAEDEPDAGVEGVALDHDHRWWPEGDDPQAGGRPLLEGQHRADNQTVNRLLDGVDATSWSIFAEAIVTNARHIRQRGAVVEDAIHLDGGDGRDAQEGT